MKDNFSNYRSWLVLFTSISTVMSLTACGLMNLDNPFVPHRPDQQVNGPRRVPVLNQGKIVPQSSVTQPAAPVTQVTQVQDPFDTYNPDGSPKEPGAPAKPVVRDVSTKEAASVAEKSSEGGFFSRLFSGSTSKENKEEVVHKPLPGNPYYSSETNAVAPIPPGPQSSSVPASSGSNSFHDTSIRPVSDKELANNPPSLSSSDSPVTLQYTEVPVSQHEVVIEPETAKKLEELNNTAPKAIETASLSAEPAKKSWWARNFAMPSDISVDSTFPTSHKDTESHSNNVFPTRTDSKTEENAESVAKETASASATSNDMPSWAPRWLGKQDNNAQANAVPDAPYPSLSSVPPTPTQFKEAKAEQEQYKQELQEDHALAQQEKITLENEPSQQVPLIPVEMPAEKAAVTQNQSNEPILLGRVSSLPQKSTANIAPAPKDISAPIPSSAPAVTEPVIDEPAAEVVEAPKPSAPEAPVQKTSNRGPYWWEGWNMFSEKEPSNSDTKNATAQDQTKPTLSDTTKNSQASTQMSVETSSESFANPVPLVEASEPIPPQKDETSANSAVTNSSLQPLPALVPVAAPVASVAISDVSVDRSNPAIASALPSPAMLEEVKVLPPSRYLRRMQAVQPRPAQ